MCYFFLGKGSALSCREWCTITSVCWESFDMIMGAMRNCFWTKSHLPFVSDVLGVTSNVFPHPYPGNSLLISCPHERDRILRLVLLLKQKIRVVFLIKSFRNFIWYLRTLLKFFCLWTKFKRSSVAVLLFAFLSELSCPF